MWQPDPDWEMVPGGRGALTVGTWRVRRDGGTSVVKRIRAPQPDEPEYTNPSDGAYWRREAEFALAGCRPRGLVPPEVHRVEEDEEGYSVWTAEVSTPEVPTPALFVAGALARLAADPAPTEPWAARDLLRSRLARQAGWPTLARTDFADLAAELWRRRTALLERYDALAVVPAHGDVVPANLFGISGDSVSAIDWGCYGGAPAGADLGYFALSCREDFDVLLDAYCGVLAQCGVPADVDEVAFAARMHAVYTVVSRAEWALSRVAPGEGALAGKFRHPAVAMHLRALQRQFPQVESLLAHH